MQYTCLGKLTSLCRRYFSFPDSFRRGSPVVVCILWYGKWRKKLKISDTARGFSVEKNADLWNVAFLKKGINLFSQQPTVWPHHSNVYLVYSPSCIAQKQQGPKHVKLYILKCHSDCNHIMWTLYMTRLSSYMYGVCFCSFLTGQSVIRSRPCHYVI